MYYLEYRDQYESYFAHRDSYGEHDRKTTHDIREAAAFKTFGEASEYSQNFGPDWHVVSY